jgi:hypothetical protein
MTVWQVYSFINRRAIPSLLYGAYLDGYGHSLESLGWTAPMIPAGGEADSELLDSLRSKIGSATLPFKYALSLLHCKNVELIDEKVPAPIRKRWKKEGIPDVIYRQIVVHPMRAQKRRSAVDDEPRQQAGREARLHICRGHFKDYRQGKGLFGKNQGIYWWDHHARGSADLGVVHKTYQVDPK